MYVSSYFATLNARAELREKISDSLSIHLSELSQYPRNESERSISVAGDGKVRICFCFHFICSIVLDWWRWFSYFGSNAGESESGRGRE